MPSRLLWSVITLSLILWAAPALCGLTADEIMDRVEAQPQVRDMTARQEMTLIDSRGHKRERILKLYLLNQGDDSSRLLFFLSPPEIKGAGLLTHDYGDAAADDDQWIFMPALGRTKRIASQQRTLSFMGSDFTYADLTRPQTTDWKYRVMEQRKWQGKAVWLVEALPKNDQVEQRWGYRKSVLFIRQDLFLVVRSVHWLSGSRKIKYVDLSRIENHGGRRLGTEVQVKTTSGGSIIHQTNLVLKQIKVNQGLDKGLFSLRGLERGP